jgi:hypothetical protein
MKRKPLNTFITATLIMLLGVSSSATAQAIVPAGNLMGTTSVTWGAETTSEIQTSIQSILVPAPPILLGPADLPSISGPSLVDDDALQYTITSNANGVDTYTLTLTREIDDVQGGAFGFSGKFSGKEAEVTLGATAAMEAANADADAIKVPSDGVIDNAVNGITNGDTVSINNNPYTVGEVVDDGITATIPLTPPLISPVAFGDRIAEREKFEVSLDTVGTITEGAETGTVTITVTATSKSPGAPEADDDVVLTLQTPVGPSVEKYVRNTSDDGQCPDQVADCGQLRNQGYAEKFKNNWYFRTKVASEGDSNVVEHNPEALIKVESGEVLEYLIVLNAGNTKEEFNIRVSETLPPFTEYEEESAKYNRNKVQMPIDTVSMDDSTNTIMFTLCPTGSSYCKLKVNGEGQVTYQVRVLGGDGERGELIKTDTYSGCLGNRQDCLPDGTPWENYNGGGHECVGNEYDCWDELHMACWCDGAGATNYCQEKGWVVGLNRVGLWEDNPYEWCAVPDPNYSPLDGPPGCYRDQRQIAWYVNGRWGGESRGELDGTNFITDQFPLAGLVCVNGVLGDGKPEWYTP